MTNFKNSWIYKSVAFFIGYVDFKKGHILEIFQKTRWFYNLKWNLSLVKIVWPLHTSEHISPPPQNNVHLLDGLIWSNNLSVIYFSSCTESVVNFEIINNLPKLTQYIMRLPKRVLRINTPTRIPTAVLNCLWLVMERIQIIVRLKNSRFFWI